MEKEEKKVVETVETPTEVNEETVVTPEQNENPVVDDNTELDSSDYNPSEVPVDDVPVEEPVVENPVIAPAEDVIPATPGEGEIVDDNTTTTDDGTFPLGTIDIPSEDQTLAQTDEVIPAPTDTIEPAVDPVIDVPGAEPVSADAPVGTEPVVSEPIIPEDPAAIAPAEDSVCACGDPNCDGSCGVTDPCASACPSSNVSIGNFFGTLQECVTIVWRFHLKTRKHHVHVVLNEFYEKALDIVDDIIEQYQGICGVCEEPFVNCIVGDGKSEGEYLTELKAFVENNKCVLGDHSEINSTIDEFLALIDSTNYKLIAFTESAVKSFEEFVYEDYPAIKEACKYDRFGDRHCDDPDDEDYDPEMENGECGAEEE